MHCVLQRKRGLLTLSSDALRLIEEDKPFDTRLTNLTSYQVVFGCGRTPKPEL